MDAIEKMTKEIGGGFEFVGGAGKKGVDEMPMKGITNLGSMKKDEWNAEVAKSSVMASTIVNLEMEVELKDLVWCWKPTSVTFSYVM